MIKTFSKFKFPNVSKQVNQISLQAKKKKKTSIIGGNNVRAQFLFFLFLD